MDFPHIDLRKITRASEKVRTTISIYTQHDYEPPTLWLEFGALSINPCGMGHEVRAFLLAAQDFEHDSALAFTLPVHGLWPELSFRNSHIQLKGWVSTNPEHPIRVPWEPMDAWYDQLDFCEECEGPSRHRVIPQGYYAGPPVDPRNEALRGLPIRIDMRVA